MKRIHIIAVFVLGIAMVTVLFSPLLAGGKLETVRYGGQYYPGEFLLKAYPQFWKNYGLNAIHILFSSGTENNMALISGNVDINCGSDSKTVSLFTAIPNQALIIATLERGNRYSTIVRADSPYKTWYDLKGKTVATRLGTGAEQVLLRYFDQVPDLSWNDFHWVNLKIEDMIAALQNGSIAAFTAWEPTPAIAEAQGVGRVLRSYGDVALVPVLLHTTVKYAQTHRDEIVRFLAAQLDKVAMIRNDPAKAAQLAAKAASAQGIQVSPDAFERVFKRVDFSLDLDKDVLAAIENTAQFLYSKGKINFIPKFRWDGSFLEEAKALRAERMNGD